MFLFFCSLLPSQNTELQCFINDIIVKNFFDKDRSVKITTKTQQQIFTTGAMHQSVGEAWMVTKNKKKKGKGKPRIKK